MITIRTIETPSEYENFFHTISLAFNPDATPNERVRLYARRDATFQRRSVVVRTVLRGAFQDATCIGTYQIEERLLCIGAARIATGCVGYVGTHPDFQRQGIASALMHDAIAFARQENFALLMLVGIPNFYQRFGYVNVADYPMQVIKLTDLAVQPASSYRVRAATEQDATSLLALYQTHYNRFERSSDVQLEALQSRLPHNPPWLACDEFDQPQGYLILPEKLDSGRAREVVATNWPATLTLLHHHAALVMQLAAPPMELFWPRPFDHKETFEVADNLAVQWQVYGVPDGEWMACVPEISRLVGLLEAEWSERWRRCGRTWHGRLTQIVGDYAFTLEVEGDKLRLLEQVDLSATTLHLHSSTFLKLLFGWRSVAWAKRRPHTQIPEEVVALAEALYPTERLWFPPSDEF